MGMIFGTDPAVAKEARSSLEDFVRPVGHAEARAEVFRKKHYGVAVLRGILLGEIFHGLDEQSLALNIARIGGLGPSTMAATGWIGQYGDGENLGHNTGTQLIQTHLKNGTL